VHAINNATGLPRGGVRGMMFPIHGARHAKLQRGIAALPPPSRPREWRGTARWVTTVTGTPRNTRGGTGAAAAAAAAARSRGLKGESREGVERSMRSGAAAQPPRGPSPARPPAPPPPSPALFASARSYCYKKITSLHP